MPNRSSFITHEILRCCITCLDNRNRKPPLVPYNFCLLYFRQVNLSVTHLYLQGNNIGVSGVSHIAFMLLENDTITHLVGTTSYITANNHVHLFIVKCQILINTFSTIPSFALYIHIFDILWVFFLFIFNTILFYSRLI